MVTDGPGHLLRFVLRVGGCTVCAVCVHAVYPTAVVACCVIFALWKSRASFLPCLHSFSVVLDFSAAAVGSSGHAS